MDIEDYSQFVRYQRNPYEAYMDLQETHTHTLAAD